MNKQEFDRSNYATLFYLKNKLPKISDESDNFFYNQMLKLNYFLIKQGLKKSNGTRHLR